MDPDRSWYLDLLEVHGFPDELVVFRQLLAGWELDENLTQLPPAAAAGGKTGVRGGLPQPHSPPPLPSVTGVEPMHETITGKEKGKCGLGNLCLDPFYEDVCHCHKYPFANTVEKP